MPGKAYDYAVIRLVPCIERGECLNVGILVHSAAWGYLGIRVDARRSVLDAWLEPVTARAVADHLDAWRRVCAGDLAAGPIASLERRERFAWLTSPRNTMLQASAVHGGVCDDPERTLDGLFRRLVVARSPAETAESDKS